MRAGQRFCPTRILVVAKNKVSHHPDPLPSSYERIIQGITFDQKLIFA
jgi:hypothetical protein